MVSSKIKKILCEINNYDLSTDEDTYDDLEKYWFDTLNLSEKDLTNDRAYDDIILHSSYSEEQGKLLKIEIDVMDFVSNNIIYNPLFWSKMNRYFKEKLENLKWSYEGLQWSYGMPEEEHYDYKFEFDDL